MRVLHCCLAAFYIDEYGYQENILPRMHREQGHDVAIVASTETYVDKTTLGYVAPRAYRTEDGIPIERLSYVQWIPHRLATKLRLYRGLYRAVADFRPDVIFLHDCQFLGIHQVARYAKAYPDVRIYVDGHTDEMNSARTWLSKNVLHRVVYRYCAQLIAPYVRKFYGVLPIRVEFFKRMYGTPADKTELLVLGAEDGKIDWATADDRRRSLRARFGFSDGTFVLVTGGKIDRRKRIDALMHAVAELDRSDVQLMVFGEPDVEMTAVVDEMSRSPHIHRVGWLSADETYDYLLAADMGVFPGTHSVLWEQAVGTGLPCLFRRWPGMEHLDVGGNCEFVESGDEQELTSMIASLADNRSRVSAMKEVALERGVPEFSYSRIARRAIET